MLSITSCQRHADQNRHEVPPRTGENGHRKQVSKQQVLARTWRKGSPSALGVGTQPGAAPVENSVELPPKIKHGAAILSNDPFLGMYPKSIRICIPVFMGALLLMLLLLVLIILLILANVCKQLKCPATDKWMKTLCYICTTESYVAVQR